MKPARSMSGLAAVLLALAWAPACDHPSPPPAPQRGTLSHLAADHRSPGGYGRAGDLTLEDPPFGILTFATAADLPGHTPLRGALVDVGVHDGGDVPDPLLTWRPGWRAHDGAVHVGPMESVEEMACEAGARGVRLQGAVDGVRLVTSVCASSSGYRASTTASGLPEGASLVDEVNAGTSHVLVEGAGTSLEGDTASPFFGISNDSLGWLVESPQMRVIGAVVHVGEQLFQRPFTLQYPGARALRSFRVVPGDAFDLLHEVALEPLAVHVGLEGEAGGEAGQVALLDGAGKPLALAPFPASGRDLSLPRGTGDDLAIYDASGVLAGRAALGAALHALVAKPPPRAQLSLRYTDAAGAPLPVHVLFRGLEGGHDPTPVLAPAPAPARPEAFAGGRSVYLVGGAATVSLAPGRYRVTATHGFRYSLSVDEVTLKPGESRVVAAALREVLPLPAWTSADFHLHAAPSPDSAVALDARVATLACEGLDFAVATDHNRVTDYGPSIDRLGVSARIVTTPGDEVTSYGPTLWGHFNVYPLPAASAAPEEAALPYFDLVPEKIFAAARAGAPDGGIVQVNHPRMSPRIGYFDLTHLEPRTGAADATFSGNFDAVEAFNGFWMTNPAKVREGAADLVALARRGLRVAATGSSDSHHLLYEEAGYPRTWVHVPAEPIATRKTRVLEAVRRGDTTVSSGPIVEMTVDGAPIGSVVVPKGGHVRVHVKVSAPAWVPVEHVEVWHDDAIAFYTTATRAAVDGVRFEGDTVLPFPVDGTILAWATADTPLPDVLPYPNARATAFTGLVYVDANGDGKIDVPARRDAKP